MATIDLRPDNADSGRWWLIWSERNEVIGSLEQEFSGTCRVIPEGGHWSPMKSIGRTYPDRNTALEDVRRYFGTR